MVFNFNRKIMSLTLRILGPLAYCEAVGSSGCCFAGWPKTEPKPEGKTITMWFRSPNVRKSRIPIQIQNSLMPLKSEAMLTAACFVWHLAPLFLFRPWEHRAVCASFPLCFPCHPEAVRGGGGRTWRQSCWHGQEQWDPFVSPLWGLREGQNRRR